MHNGANAPLCFLKVELMAKTTKDSIKETAETNEPKIEKKLKIKMVKTYIGSAGCFYAGRTYESDEKIFSEFLKNKDAVEC